MIDGTPWYRRRMVSLDLETTDKDPEIARIVQSAVVAVGDHRVETMSLLIDPGVEISSEAAAVHGISTERAREEGVPADAGLTAILTTLAELLPDGEDRALVVFNAPYDLTVLDREARRHGLMHLAERVRARVVDPLVIDKHLDRYRPARVARHKLEAVCEVYGALHDGAHDATYDAIAAARCAWVMGVRGQVVRRERGEHERREKAELVAEWEAVRGDLHALHAAQVEWYRAQAEAFADYLHELRQREGDDTPVIVNTVWPVAPYRDAAL